MAQSTVIINSVVGTAWFRLADGSLQPLKEGMRVSVDAEIVTGQNTRVELQADDVDAFVFGENREILLSPSMFTTDIDISEFQVAHVTDPDLTQLLATLDGLGVSLDLLDPTAEALSDTDTDSNFVRLLNSVETNTPLDLHYPNTVTKDSDSNLSGIIESAETVVPTPTGGIEKQSALVAKPNTDLGTDSDLLNTVAQDFINESLNKGSDS